MLLCSIFPAFWVFFVVDVLLSSSLWNHLVTIWYLLTVLQSAHVQQMYFDSLTDWSWHFPLVFSFKPSLGKFQAHAKIETMMIPHVSNTQLQWLTIHDQSFYIHLQTILKKISDIWSFHSQVFHSVYLEENDL